MASPGRKAVKITVEELKQKIEATVLKLDKDADISDTYEEVISVLKFDHKKIHADLAKVQFDLENTFIDGNDTENAAKANDLLGYHTLPNGLSFLGVYAGGDWEFPVFFIIYWDGKSLRGYIPEKGNVYNTTNMKAFGNGEPYDEDAEDEDMIWLREKFPGKYDDKEEYEYFDQSILYNENIDFDWDLLKQEIETRIIVI